MVNVLWGFILFPAFEILFNFCAACPEERSDERVALLYYNNSIQQ
jgi:hypothetical protein